MIFTGATVAAQLAGWWAQSPAVMTAGSVAALGLLVCVPNLWRRHRDDIQYATHCAEQADQIRRATDTQLSAEQARLTDEWQAWRHSQIEALDESVEAWCRDLSTVLTERRKPESSATGLSPRTANLLDKALDEVDEELVDVQDACEHAVVFLAQRLQAGGLQIQEKAGGLLGRPEPGLPELGLEIDHLATTFAHHAQSLRILGGSWTGQQWQQTVPLTDIVRAAGGQITDYQRVVIGGEPDLGVKDFAAEWLIHLVAELLGNATMYSPCTKEVTAQLEAVPSGAVVQIDDRGTGMTEARLERARELVAGERDAGLRDLQTPQVGLAVVGNIARRLKLQVSLGRSPYGGIRAVVLVPMDLLEAVDPVDSMPLPEGVSTAPAVSYWREEAEAVVPARTGASAPAPVIVAPAPPSEEPDRGRASALPEPSAKDTGLPRRRSPRHSRHAAPAAEAEANDSGIDEDPEAAASFMSTFVLGGRTSSPDETDSPRGDDDR